VSFLYFVNLANQKKYKTMDCPRCKVELRTNKLSDVKLEVEVDSCPKCEGTWFEQNELSRLEQIIEPTLLEIRHIPSKVEQLNVLTCPKCGVDQRLHKAEHERDRKVIIDFCPDCKGTWLDKGELLAIQKENWAITLLNFFKWVTGKDK